MRVIMKTGLFLLGSAIAATAAHGAEPRLPVPQSEVSGEVKTEKGAYLGVVVSPAARALRRQLKLPEGVGLVVDSVVPGGPAESAGLKRDDVLQKLDDQLLIDPQQFAVLVRLRKPGEELKLSALHEGQAQSVTVKLGEHELAALDEARPRMFMRAPGRMPPPPHMRLLPPPGGPPLLVPPGPGSVTWDDGKTIMKFTNRDGKTYLQANDKDGKSLFDGPVDREEDRQKLPKELRDKVERLRPPPAVLPFGDGPHMERTHGSDGPQPDDRPAPPDED